MTRNSTKRALLLSALSLLLCVSMLVGTTFAWFTDSASTNVNKIQSGKLDVALVDENNNSLEGKALEFVKAEGGKDEDILWEPGCTYELPAVYVVNNGNLHLKYQIVITGIAGDAKLNEAIEWYINDTAIAEFNKEGALAPTAKSEALVIKGHMKEEAGNEFQNLSINGISITVLATQQTAEHDSIDNTYDENAYYYTEDEDGNIMIENAAGLISFANAVNNGNNTFSGKTVYLTNDINLNGMIWTPIGQTGATQFLGTFDGREHTISNFTIDSSKQTGNYASGLFGWTSEASGNIQNVNVDNAVVIGHRYVGVIAGYIAGNMTIDNCHVTNSKVTSIPERQDANYNNGDKAGGIVGYMNAGNTVKNCSVKNSTITAYRDLGGIVGAAYGTAQNNVVENVTLIQDYTNNYEGVKATIDDVIGRTFSETPEATGNTATNVKREFILVPGIDVAAVLAYANKEGDVIRFTEGLYTGVNNAVAAKGVTLIGDENAVIEIPALNSADNVHTYILQLGDNTKMSGLTFKTSASTTYKNGSSYRHEVIGLTGNTVLVEGCVFDLTGTQYNALCVEYKGTNITLKDCEVIGGYESVSCGDSQQSGGNVTIENCKLSNATYGIHLNANGHNIIVKDTQVEGWVTIWGNGADSTGDVQFNNCTFSNGYFSLYRNMTFEGCTFKSNMGLTMQGNAPAGITLTFGANNEWEGTTVYDKVIGDKDFAKDFSAIIGGVTYNYTQATKTWTQA